MKRVKKEEENVILLFDKKIKPEQDAVAPATKRRRLKVEVVVPTVRQLYGDDHPVIENALDFVENNFADVIKEEEDKFHFKILNDQVDVKVKKEEMMSDDVVHRRLALIGHETYDIGLDPAIRDVTTTRQFTSARWGGNTQSTFPEIGKKFLDKHGLDDFMYPNLFFNPHAPRWPGAPGLFFGCSISEKSVDAWSQIQRVVVRLNSAVWKYVGQYQMTPAPNLTPDEWMSQAPRVKQTWVAKIIQHQWGDIVRAKIVLQRRLHRNPTMDELDDALESDEKFIVSPEAIYKSFEDGHAVLRSWYMKCVGYDEDFQRVIAAGSSTT